MISKGCDPSVMVPAVPDQARHRRTQAQPPAPLHQRRRNSWSEPCNKQPTAKLRQGCTPGPAQHAARDLGAIWGARPNRHAINTRHCSGTRPLTLRRTDARQDRDGRPMTRLQALPQEHSDTAQVLAAHYDTGGPATGPCVPTPAGGARVGPQHPCTLPIAARPATLPGTQWTASWPAPRSGRRPCSWPQPLLGPRRRGHQSSRRRRACCSTWSGLRPRPWCMAGTRCSTTSGSSSCCPPAAPREKTPGHVGACMRLAICRLAACSAVRAWDGVGGCACACGVHTSAQRMRPLLLPSPVSDQPTAGIRPPSARSLDDLLRTPIATGIAQGQITELAGETSSGKTQVRRPGRCHARPPPEARLGTPALRQVT